MTSLRFVTAVGLGIAISSELLAAMHAFTPGWVRLFWAVGFVAAAAVAVRVRWRPRFSLDWKLTGLFVLFGLVLVIGARSVPNTLDSMTYHLPRAVHWLNQGSFSYWETPILRQHYQMPFAEMAIAHLIALTASDVWVELPQWVALVGSSLAAYRISGHMGGDKSQQRLSAVFVGAAPMAVLQGSSTQNDLIVAMWLLFGVCFLYERSPWFGPAMALALLTKGTAWIFAPAILIWFLLRRRSARRVLVVAVMVLALNGPHLIRLSQVPVDDPYTNTELSSSTVLSNLTRNLALQTPPLSGAVVWLHETMGWDINDAGRSWPGFSYRPRLIANEAEAAAPVRMLLIAVALIFPLTSRRYMTIVGVGFVLFAVTLRWQPWHTRLLLPLLALSGPWVSVNLRKWRGLTAALLLLGFVFVFADDLRPPSVVMSGGEMFKSFPVIEDDYLQAIRELEQCREVRLIVVEDHAWEYPAWHFLGIDPLGGRLLGDETTPPDCSLRISQYSIEVESP